MKYGRLLGFAMVAGLAAGLVTKSTPAQAQETGDRHPYSISLMGGYIDMEGDFPTKDGFAIPKSIIFAMPSFVTMMLPGLRSRWMTPPL